MMCAVGCRQWLSSTLLGRCWPLLCFFSSRRTFVIPMKWILTTSFQRLVMRRSFCQVSFALPLTRLKQWIPAEEMAALAVFMVDNRENSPSICNSDEMDFDDAVSMISDEEELLPSQLNFALPLTRLKQRIPAEEMAALAVFMVDNRENSPSIYGKGGRRRMRNGGGSAAAAGGTGGGRRKRFVHFM